MEVDIAVTIIAVTITVVEIFVVVQISIEPQRTIGIIREVEQFAATNVTARII